MIKVKLDKHGMFATPKSDEALQKYLENFSGNEKVIAFTASGLTWNRTVEKLQELEHDDFEIALEENSEPSIWITVGDIAVYVKRTDEGVAVDMYTNGDECNDEEHLAGCYAFFNEAKKDDFDDDFEGHPV